MPEGEHSQTITARNPGPNWGYRFLRLCDRVLPEWAFRPARAIGTFVALMAMPAQRRHSAEYLQIILERPPSMLEVFRHFFAFEEFLMLKLRIANGKKHRCRLAENTDDFEDFLNSSDPALLGTLHFAHSDLLGFLLGDKKRRRVSMVRLKVANSEDTDELGKLFEQWVSFIWVNEGEDLLFALKEAINAGESIALKCDRVEFSAKTESFHFLNARRIFPFTIYYLALIFRLPVILSVGIPGDSGESVVVSTRRWIPDPALQRAENLALARAHFQSFLNHIESLLRRNPYWWFNFLELNPEVAL